MKFSTVVQFFLAWVLGAHCLFASQKPLKRGRSASPVGGAAACPSGNDGSPREDRSASEKQAVTKRRELRAEFLEVVSADGASLSEADRECEDIRARLKAAFSRGAVVPAGSPAVEQSKVLQDGAKLLDKLRLAIADSDDLEFDEKKSHALADEMMQMLASFPPTFFGKIRQAVTRYNEQCGRSIPPSPQDPLSRVSFTFQQCRTEGHFASPLYAFFQSKPEEALMSLSDKNHHFLNAVLANNLDDVTHWISQEAMLHCQDAGGRNALHLAAGNGFGGILDYLLRVVTEKRLLGDMLEQHDAIGFTPLYAAIAMRRVDAVARLLDAGANACAGGLRGGIADSVTALHLAASLGYGDIIDCIITWARNNCLLGDYLEKQDGAMATPLQVAVAKGNHTAALRLLNAGADIKNCTPDWGRLIGDKTTALHIAAIKGDIVMLEALVEWACSKGLLVHLIDAQDGSGSTALHDAVENNQAEAVSLLLAAGADAEVEDSNGQNPFQVARALSRHDLVELFEYNATGPGADDESDEYDSSEGHSTSSSDDEGSDSDDTVAT